ncbi:hypothetical protein DEDE109153_11375 [Deinococcus deserti]
MRRFQALMLTVAGQCVDHLKHNRQPNPAPFSICRVGGYLPSTGVCLFHRPLTARQHEE